MKIREKGFTMIELVLVLGVALLFAAVMSPYVNRYIKDAQISRASNDARVIGEAINAFNKNFGEPPGWVSGAAARTATAAFVDLLIGPGQIPANAGGSAADWAIGVRTQDANGGWAYLADHLMHNTPGYATTGRFFWMGPYMADISEDPWGFAYLVNIEFAKPGATANAVFVISGGPEKTIATAYSQSRTASTTGLSADDVGFRLR